MHNANYYMNLKFNQQQYQKFNDSCTGKGEVSFLPYAEEIARLEKMKAEKKAKESSAK